MKTPEEIDRLELLAASYACDYRDSPNKTNGIPDSYLVYSIAYDAFLDGYKAAMDQVADADKVMNSPNNSNGWISVKDRLPDVFKVYDFYRESNCVLITVAKESDQQTFVNPYVTVAHLTQFKSEEHMWTACRCSVSGNDVEPNEWKLDQVIYWMPLPKPPEDK